MSIPSYSPTYIQIHLQKWPTIDHYSIHWQPQSFPLDSLVSCRLLPLSCFQDPSTTWRKRLEPPCHSTDPPFSSVFFSFTSGSSHLLPCHPSWLHNFGPWLPTSSCGRAGSSPLSQTYLCLPDRLAPSRSGTEQESSRPFPSTFPCGSQIDSPMAFGSFVSSASSW